MRRNFMWTQDATALDPMYFVCSVFLLQPAVLMRGMVPAFPSVAGKARNTPRAGDAVNVCRCTNVTEDGHASWISSNACCLTNADYPMCTANFQRCCRGIYLLVNSRDPGCGGCASGHAWATSSPSEVRFVLIAVAGAADRSGRRIVPTEAPTEPPVIQGGK